MEFNIPSLNVRGLNNNSKRKKVFKWCENYDIVCLQETFCTKEKIAEFDKDWDGMIHHSVTDSPHSRGVLTLIRANKNIICTEHHASYDGRILLTKLNVNESIISVVNVYAPTNMKDKADFLKRLKFWIRWYVVEDEKLTRAGDMNTDIDGKTTRNTTDSNSKLLLNILKCMKMVDTWKSVNRDDSNRYTWVSPANPQMQSRIDYIFISEDMLNYVNHSK